MAASPPLSRVVGLADELETSAAPWSDLRAHERLKPSDLQWLRSARLKYGSEVRVLDISAGGLLLETDHELKPDASVIVELGGAANPILIPSRVLRCRVASLGEILLYQGACAFKRPLALPELLTAPGRSTGAAASLPAPAAAQSVPAGQKVIARYSDGRVARGYTTDFHPSKSQLHLSPNPRQGDSILVALSQLKALFFVREFAGDPTFVEQKAFAGPRQGRGIEVTFHDNETLVGSTLGYRAGASFFVHPADPGSNNIRVFVPATGVRRVRLL